MLTGAAVIPVSVVGPLAIELGDYELEEPFGHVTETGRTRDQVFVPLAHTEGGLSASLYRGARAAADSGGFRTFVLGDRITRASCFVCTSTKEAVQLARFLGAHVAEAWSFPATCRTIIATSPCSSPMRRRCRREKITCVPADPMSMPTDVSRMLSCSHRLVVVGSYSPPTSS